MSVALCGMFEKNPLLRLLRKYTVGYWSRFAIGLGLLTVSLFAQRVPALILGVALDGLLLEATAYSLPLVPDGAIPATTNGQFLMTVSLIGGALLIEATSHYFSNRLYTKATLGTLHDLRVGVYRTLINFDAATFEQEETGDLMGIVNNDVDNIEKFFEALRDGVIHAGGIVVAFIFMSAVHWELTVLVLLLPVTMLTCSRLYASKLQSRFERVRENVGNLNNHLRDTVTGIESVKSLAEEDAQRNAISSSSERYMQSNWSTIRLRLGFESVVYPIASTGTWGVFLIGGYWILAGPVLFFSQPLTPGTLLTFLIYTQSFLAPTRRFAIEVLNKYEDARASAGRVTGLLDKTTSEDGETRKRAVEPMGGRIQYEDVSFEYEDGDAQALTGINATIRPGEFVGVVGPTGSGKSTLLKLLLGFYAPDTGSIRVDGHDISEVDLRSLRNEIGYVNQDPVLFPGTIYENIAYAVDDPEEADIVRAAWLAGAHEFIKEFPDSYHTDIGEQGKKLSGGQRQRITIARAYLNDPSILILDEAMSNVDNRTMFEIQRSLSRISEDRTVIAIAHRLSTIRHADTILVLDEGQIFERGTHDELLDYDGVYADLWKTQIGAVDSDVTSTVRQSGSDVGVSQ